MTSVLASSRSMRQFSVLNLLLLVSIVSAICTASATAARLLPEDRGFYVSHVNASPATLIGPALNSAVDGGSIRPDSEVARSGNPRDGLESVVHVNDIARPGGFNIINAQSTEISFNGKIIHSKPHWSSWSGCNNKANHFVFNVFRKGPVTPSGPSHKVYATVTERRLSESKHSYGAGHMQEEIRKRILGSVPSPGVGH